MDRSQLDPRQERREIELILSNRTETHGERSAAGIRWNLSDLFKAHDDARIEKSLNDCRSRAKKFAECFRTAMDNPQTLTPDKLLQALKELETISEALGRVGSYAGLLYASDTAKPDHQDLEQRIEQRSTEIRNLLLFFELAWLKIEDETGPRAHQRSAARILSPLSDDSAALPTTHAIGSVRKAHRRGGQHRTQRFRSIVL